jgi:hypothetical protein
MHIEMHCASAFRTCGTIVQLVPFVARDELPSAGDAFDPLVAVLRPAVPVDRFGTAHRTFNPYRFGHGDVHPFVTISMYSMAVTETLRECYNCVKKQGVKHGRGMGSRARGIGTMSESTQAEDW